MTAEVRVLDTPSLGDRSYVIASDGVAMVIDPQRDIERAIEAAESMGARITHVVETHVHNDYVTGGLALARALGAAYLLPDGEHGAFDHGSARSGAAIESGPLRLVPIRTPGHTPTHTSYLWLDEAGADGPASMGIFTGGSMLYGAVGRTDLCGEALTRTLSLQQHASVRHLAATVGEQVPVLPTHGFGSHCSSGTSEIHRSGTVGEEQRRNPALLQPDGETFATALIAGLGPYPRYYERIAPANLLGPPAIAGPPRLRDGRFVAAELEAGSMVVDLRPRAAYASSHIPGTVNVELRNDLPTYLGWVHDEDTPIVLLAPTEEALAEAAVMLGRIGLDALQGAVTEEDGSLDGCPAPETSQRVTWEAVNDGRPEDAVLLDVRDTHEWESGHHSAAVHVPFHQVLSWQEGRSDGAPIWVYCATGNRAAVASSLLARAGHSTTLVDDFCLPGDVPG